MLVHLLVGDFHTQDSFPVLSLLPGRESQTHFLFSPHGHIWDHIFSFFFASFCHLAFSVDQTREELNYFYCYGFLAYLESQIGCSISCCCVSIWLCFSLSKRCCSRQLLLLLEDPLNHRLHRHRHTLTEGDRCCGFTQ